MRSRLVAETTRTSTEMVLAPPSRRTTRDSSARNSLGCSSSGNSPISSRKRVPPLARSKAPGTLATAPVKAPRSWPNNSLSIIVAGMGQRFGDALLAGAGLALHEHGRVGAGERGQARGQGAKGGRLADEAVEV